MRSLATQMLKYCSQFLEVFSIQQRHNKKVQFLTRNRQNAFGTYFAPNRIITVLFSSSFVAFLIAVNFCAIAVANWAEVRMVLFGEFVTNTGLCAVMLFIPTFVLILGDMVSHPTFFYCFLQPAFVSVARKRVVLQRHGSFPAHVGWCSSVTHPDVADVISREIQDEIYLCRLQRSKINENSGKFIVPQVQL